MGAMQKLKNLFVGEDELEQEDAMYQQPVYENKTEYIRSHLRGCHLCVFLFLLIVCEICDYNSQN